jgi:hypothetical protein
MSTRAPAPAAPLAGAPKKPNLPKAILTLIATLALAFGAIVGLGYGYRAGFGSEVGGKCEDLTGCKPGGVCISKRCYQGCKVDGDCRAGWHCGRTEVEITRRGGYSLTDDKSQGEEQICFGPKK